MRNDPLPRAPATGTCLARLLLLGSLALAHGCAAAPLPEGGPVEAGMPIPPAVRGRLAPDDVLSVIVFGHPEMSAREGGVRVDHEGNVDLPLLGPVRVGDLTLEEARAALHERASRYLKQPFVAVSVLAYAPRLFYLLGAVERGGPFEIDRPLSALAALSFGEGFRQGADRERIALLRRGGEELEVRFFDAASPGPDGLVGVMPGDLIFVRRSAAGDFRDQILPYLQGIAPPFAALATMVIAADSID